MGVRGLWKILEPTAQPVQLESLRGKILAIDASIWMYHFVKAMRDTKGTVLAAAHIIGFFRRICKLLFYEIKPVFVFDGAPPILKKETTNKRNERRLNREQTARNAANKLLTIQLQRLKEKSKTATQIPSNNDNSIKIIGDIPENAVYLEDLEADEPTTGQENKQDTTNRDTTKPFIQTDQYHLPEIGQIAPIRSDDQRILTQEELDEYAAQFTSQARGGFIDTSLVDFHSKEFERLPIETQYQLLNMARMKSRLRMGYTAEELNKMFPNEMEFSKFQISRVAQRNFFTQKLMHLVGMEEDLTRRISSEKDKEYFLKRTDQGWSLSLEGKTSDIKNKPTDNTSGGNEIETKIYGGRKENVSDEDEDFEEIDIEPEKETNEIKSDSQDVNYEPVDLASEDSAHLDELFGYEASLTRKSVYDRLMDEVNTTNAPKEGTTSGEKPKKSIMSMMFDDEKTPETSDEAQKKTDSESTKAKNTAVPWFEDNDHLSQEMQITEREDPNFVDVHELQYHQEEIDVPDDHQVSSPIQVIEQDDHMKKEPEKSKEEIVENKVIFNEHIEEHPIVKSPSEETPVTQSLPSADIAEQKSKEPKKEIIKSEIVLDEPTKKIVESEKILDEPTNDKPKELKEEPEEINVIQKIPGEESKTSTEDLKQSKEKEELVEVTEPHISDENPVEVEKDDHPQTASKTDVTSLESIERAEEEAKDAEEEEENIAGMLVAELEENERFARELAESSNRTWTAEDETEYENQVQLLRKQFTDSTRDAETITVEMVQECQELLQLFGIPYITAPAEAEAQCAELKNLKLVDGIVTDDGDTFLFDDNAIVYRNMFSQARFVEFYSTKEIHHKLGLDREKLIDLAFLLGSDYTEGILGIGPVTGMEIIAEFGNLKAFAEWWNHAQRFPDEAEVDTTLKRRLLKQFKTKLFLPEDFPNPTVVDAYLHPSVDTDSTKFSWGTPDLESIRKMLALTAGWSSEKVNSVILPVVQEAKRRELQRKTFNSYNQSHIGDYYASVIQNPALGSKRTQKAVQSIRKRAKKD